MSNPVKDSYEDGLCPDCQDEIPDDVQDGDSCKNCGHVFWENDEEDLYDDFYDLELEDEDWDPDDDLFYA